MANMAYPILLFVFIFGAVAGYINDTGLYSSVYVVPTQNNSVSTGSVQELNDAAQSMGGSDMSYFTGYLGWIISGAKALGAGLVALFTLGPMLESFGLEVGLVGMFISPLGLVALMWVMSYWTGREPE